MKKQPEPTRRLAENPTAGGGMEGPEGSPAAPQEGEALYRSLFENNHAVMLLIDPDSSAIVDANPAACTYYGWSRNDLRKKTIDEINTLTREEVFTKMELARQQKRNNFFFKHRRADGEVRDVEVYSGPLTREGKTLLYSIVHDITGRKKAQESLAESEQKFRMAFQTSPDSINLNRLSDGMYIDINEGFTKLTGYTREEAIGRTSIDLKIWHDPQDRERLVRSLSQEGFVENLEAAFRRKNGEIGIGLMSARRLQLNGEEIILSITRDITERKAVENALRESEDRYRQIVEASTDAILVRCGDIITYANPAAVRLFRAGHERELIGKSYLDLVHPADRAASAARIARGMNENWIAPPRSHRVLTLDGQLVHVESSGVPIQYQGKTQLFGVFRDITDRKQAEENLRETEKKYRELADSLPQVIFEVDLDGNLTYLNRNAYALFGYSPEEVKAGFNVLDAFAPEDREHVARDIIQNVQGEKMPRREYTAVRKDGSRFPVGIHANRVWRGETPIGVRGILIDLTATRRAEEEKLKLETQLQQAQKMEAIGALAGGIAHDFNNILSAIIGYTELAVLNDASAVCAGELNQALIAANRAKDLVKQILAFSRQTDEERAPVKLGAVVKEAIKFLRATIPSTIDMKVRIPEDAGAVLANSVELHQIIMNLCTNAVHAIGERGGVLEVDVRNIEIDQVQKRHFIELDAGAFVRVSVKDTGYGMTPEVLERIFDPYFTTKEKGVGTGLGLAVVHGIVSKSGGAIKVESAPGQGTTFHVYLPRVDRALPRKAEPPEPIVGGFERILFVDDEKMLVDIGGKILERLGYQVVSRTSPLEALELFRAKPDHFDLVVTDQTMPGMTGDLLAKELMRIRPDIPIVVCTGYSQGIDPERARQRGIKALVMKPILIHDMAAAVRKALQAT
ncbi:MAG: PAS domain S-box protein [Desulfobacterales bacterium]